ncbi:MAG: phosphoadenosine phosphosulfate reductase family protein [Chitinophagales bacterium]|nr:phosphoadenosine phosphosulfate reductase family protein [Chitinophagaceae bacterium]MCB9064556.1 phosphoadenosine phosphosulfate reductase family protein [Chitinophagales bacterium]
MSFCSNCLLPTTKDIKTIELIRNEYLSNDTPWFVGYSGGKDSSALLTLVVSALKDIKVYKRPVTVVYCDTGVENPIVTKYVYETFSALKNECDSLGIPIQYKIVKPKLEERFFVKVIGKGYPTPTNIFRWCTKYLRINPVKKAINSKEQAIVLLGVRKNESEERNRTLNENRIDKYYYKQKASSNTKIFSPIIDYSIKDVWSTIKFKSIPVSINHNVIGSLYKDAGAECPVFREDKGSPCGKGRFGCWTCTVVRKDKSVEKLIENGYSELVPYFTFRNWLSEFRDNQKYRSKVRRNGQVGLGPITIKGRKVILKKLQDLEKLTNSVILEKDELRLIKQYWKEDIANPKYVELL